MPTLTRSFLCALPALTTLAVLGLAAAHPQAADAQSLTLTGTDDVTVNGLGTFGTINNNTTSYMDVGGSNVYAVEAKDASTFTLGSGGTLSADIGDTGVLDLSSGAVNITGGTVTAGDGGHGLVEGNSGAVTISGGTLTAGTSGYGLYAEGAGGAINITGGILTAGDGGYGLYTSGTEDITVSGGTLSAGDNGFGLYDEGPAAVTISGGTIEGGYLGLFDGGGRDVTITGGTITADGFALDDNGGGGAIDLYGSFTGLTPGEIESLPAGFGSFFGTLENDSVGQTFTYDNGGTITLHDVGLAATPEPSGFVGLGIGLLGLGALGMKARRRSVIPG